MEMWGGSSAWPNITITFYVSETDRKVVGSVNGVHFCRGGTYTFDLQMSIPPVTINFSCTCPEKPGFVYRPTIPIYGRSVGTNIWCFCGNMVNGDLLYKN